jgi:hypothetical protein
MIDKPTFSTVPSRPDGTRFELLSSRSVSQVYHEELCAQSFDTPGVTVPLAQTYIGNAKLREGDIIRSGRHEAAESEGERGGGAGRGGAPAQGEMSVGAQDTVCPRQSVIA